MRLLLPTLLRRCTNVSSRNSIKTLSAFLHPLDSELASLEMCSPMNGHGQNANASLMHDTKTLAVDVTKLGTLLAKEDSEFVLDDWGISLDDNSSVQNIRLAVEQLQQSNIPVAFPTETVYGLGADATRSEAVRGIYKAKQRPLDNPLIVHFASLRQLAHLLEPKNHRGHQNPMDVIPPIYKPLIKAFWPGPLTIILQNPKGSPLAPEVTAGLSTFGARMPRNLLALLLIKLAEVPIAAPSANASTRPSPTAAEHVKDDLDGRINYIVDGGPCDVGVESTVVDGLSNPPAVLRPGGISIEQLRACPGWENVVVGYKDASEGNANGAAPRAPGMKYRHYSPAATVILHESGSTAPNWEDITKHGHGRIGLVRTRNWEENCGLATSHGPQTGAKTTSLQERKAILIQKANGSTSLPDHKNSSPDTLRAIQSIVPKHTPVATKIILPNPQTNQSVEIYDIYLGTDAENVARGLFSALRELDRKKVDVIFVEGIDDGEGDVAAAVMNRLRKAAEVMIS
jgi:L-threonylcarbamoyladenylate synthase